MQDVAGPSSQSEPTDERLLRDYVASEDAGAFAAIMRRHGGMVSGVCRRVLGREQDVEDMLRPRLWTIGSLVSAALLAPWVGFLSYGAVRVLPVGVAPVAVFQAEPKATIVLPDQSVSGDWKAKRVNS